jgi:hypothetical protein
MVNQNHCTREGLCETGRKKGLLRKRVQSCEPAEWTAATRCWGEQENMIRALPPATGMRAMAVFQRIRPLTCKSCLRHDIIRDFLDRGIFFAEGSWACQRLRNWDLLGNSSAGEYSIRCSQRTNTNYWISAMAGV